MRLLASPLEVVIEELRVTVVHGPHQVRGTRLARTLEKSPETSWSEFTFLRCPSAGIKPYKRGNFRRPSGETRDLQTGCWSGRTMARTGLRMMPTFPSSPLRFRTAGFPQYGSKAGLSDGAFPCGASIASLGLHPSFVSSAT